MRRALALSVLMLWGVGLQAQDVSLEYRVKAAYLYNFVKYVEWPDGALGAGTLNICVAGRNPFGSTLDDLVRGETLDGRSIVARVILEPEPDCHVMFVPRGSAAGAYLRGSRDLPSLTVGESPDFISLGGIVNFVLEGSNVRFEINREAAERVNLRISSRLLRLARGADGRGYGQ